METDTTASNVNTQQMLPDGKKAAPETGSRPSYQPSVENYADNKETADKVINLFASYYERFKDQGARDKAEEEMDIADELWRAAMNRTMLRSDQSANTEESVSKYRSATYNSEIRTITSNELDVVFGNETDLPVVYEPLEDIDGPLNILAEKEAPIQSATLAWVFQKTPMIEDIKKAWRSLNKYGNKMLEIVWENRKESRLVRMPLKTKEGEQPKFTYKRKEIVVAEFPRIVAHDLRNSWFDAMIDGAQDQSAIIFRQQNQISDLYSMERGGDFLNTDKIGKGQIYKGEGDNDVMDERLDNADENQNTEPETTLIDIFRGYLRAPINDKGKYDPTGTAPRWFKVAIAGDLSSKDVVPLQISPCLEYELTGQIPCLLWHAIDDDKGAFHVGYAWLVKSLLAMEMSIFDATMDNVRLGNRAPWLADRNSISIRDKVFAPSGNAIWWLTPGSRDPRQATVQDRTNVFIPMMNVLSDAWRRVLGTNKPLMGEPFGQRTSASESISAYEQALKPFVEDLKYKAMQILPWVGFWVKEMMRHYLSPKKKLMIHHGGIDYVISPNSVMSDFLVKVTAIKRFQDNVIARKQDDQIMSTVLPQAIQAGIIDKKGGAEFLKQYLKRRDIQNIDKIVSIKGEDFDAQQNAQNENTAILWHGILDMPKENENHAIHIANHDEALVAIEYLPKEERPPQEHIAILKRHRSVHKQMMDGQTPQAQPTLPQQPVEGAVPALPGQQAGDVMGALMGNEGNLEAGTPVEMGAGRPALAEEIDEQV